jgi:hypothetical protein
MTTELIVFVSLSTGLTVFQAATAQKPKADGTVYNLLDRVSWIVGGALALAVGFWRPWFISTWWKAAIFAPILCIAFSAFFLSMVGSVMTTKTDDYQRIAIQVVAYISVLIGVFFALKSYGT